jgi:uncharacterized phiE125 gp8 family phage protein
MQTLRQIIRLTHPTVEPLSLAEARESLRISPRQIVDGAYISALISAARQQAEEFIDCAICQASFVLVLDGVAGKSVRLNYPATSVTAVSYRADSGDTVLLDFEYDAQLRELFFDEEIAVNGLKVEIVAGVNAGWPESLVRAVAMLLGDLYTNRTSAEYVNRAALAMLMPFKNRPIL